MAVRNISIAERTVGRWPITTVEFTLAKAQLPIAVTGVIANSVPTSDRGRHRLAEWKRLVAGTVKQNRGLNSWDNRWTYAISVGFSFNPGIHGSQPLDIENFLKPCIDAIAAGLFCPNAQDLREIPKYNYDDSNFIYLFVQRLSDAPTASDEGAAFFVSAIG